MLDIKQLRKEYQSKSLDLKDLKDDPFEQFKIWFQEAQKTQILEPNAMCLATANAKAKPSSRMILLKEMDDKGFIFFTNYESRKAHEMDENPFASMTFFWKELERQVTIEGNVEKTSLAISQAYFASRPRGSQLGTWSSEQGKVIASREVLEDKRARLEKHFEGKDIPLPSFWGGFRLIPNRFDFWQGRPNRLHDRFQYSLEGQIWHIDRLSP